jgi:hypothetical protein
VHLKETAERLLNIPVVNVKNKIIDHMNDQIKTVISAQNSPEKYAAIKYTPLSQIIKLDKDVTEEARQSMSTDIPYLPVAEIKEIPE